MPTLKGVLIRGINLLVGNYERLMLLKGIKELKFPPVFIIGPPRSGTTLVYQLLTHTYYFSYFSNITALCYKFPVMATKVFKPFLKDYKSDFKSSYGRVAGLAAPHEAGQIWNRWFPTNFHYVGKDYLLESTKKQVYNTVAGIERLYDAPFLNKNVKNSVRIQALADIFPTCLFIEVERDPVATAISILKGRRSNLKDISQWWSVMPKQIDDLKDKHYLDQIAGQVYYIRKNISCDKERVGEGKFFRVRYEDICTKPDKELEAIRSFLVSKGVTLEATGHTVPESFPRKEIDYGSLSPEEEQLASKILKIFGQGE